MDDGFSTLLRPDCRMNSRPKVLAPWLRWAAAVTLLCWIAAASLCTAHCAGFCGHGDAGQPSCHAAAASHHDDDGDHPSDPAHHDSSPTALCLALKAALPNLDTGAHFPPNSALLHLFAPPTFAVDATSPDRIENDLRQARAREWVFTPEVCLGPACRSLAPPFLRLA